MSRAELAAQLDTASVGQSHVEHGDVGLRRVDAVKSVLDRARLTDHLEVFLAFEEFPDPPPNYFVIINQKDLQSHP